MTTSSTEQSPLRLGAIDIGTNSIRLVVVEVDEDGTYRVLDEEREMSRLGQGLYETGRLVKEPIERSLEALGRMKAIAEGLGVSELKVIATSAVREAPNGRTFGRQARRRHGLRIDVITAEEEARLAFLSVTRQFNLDGQPVAMVDIGGGSVEVVLSAGTVVDQVYSLPLGAVRLTERYSRSDPLHKSDWKKLRNRIDQVIERRIGKPPLSADMMVGSGGTFSALAEMARGRNGSVGNVQGYALSRAEVVELLRRMRDVPLEERRRTPGLNPDRADIIVAGVAVISRLAKRLGAREIFVNEGGVREGLLLSMIAERAGGLTIQPRDRMEWVRLFARKCGINEGHCEHVAGLATQIFDSVREAYDIPAESREILEAAALLHDVGYLIGHAKHHKHAYHVIMHSELPGFSGREIELIANVARYHRRAPPKKGHTNFKRLDRADRQLVRFLSGILRVAAGLDRANTQAVKSVACEVGDDRILCRVEADEHPQVELWGAEHKAALFENAFDARLELEWTERAKASGTSAGRARPPPAARRSSEAK